MPAGCRYSTSQDQMNLVGFLEPCGSWKWLTEGTVRGGRHPFLPLLTRSLGPVAPSTADCPRGCIIALQSVAEMNPGGIKDLAECRLRPSAELAALWA